MKLEIRVDTDTHLDIPWPDGIPVPMAGDQVVMKVGTETIGFTVARRFYGIGTNPHDGTPLAQLRIVGTGIPDENPAQ